MSLGGCLTVSLFPSSDQASAVINIQRSLPATTILSGKSIKQAVSTLPLLFNVCGRAQAVAAISCAEQLLGLTPPPNVTKQRELLVKLEILHEHLWSVLVKLPTLLGLQPRQQEMAVVSKELQHAMQQLNHNNSLTELEKTVNESTLSNPMSICAQTTEEIKQTLSGTLAEPSLTQIESSSSISGQLIDALSAVDWTTNYQPQFLPEICLSKLEALSSITDPQVAIEQLNFQTHLGETGTLVRQLDHSWVVESSRRFGYSLRTRLTAIFAEIYTLLEDFEQLNVNISPKSVDSNSVICSVETARGRLVQYWTSEVDNQGELQLQNLLLISPTDWNFSPYGAAFKVASELVKSNNIYLQQRAELMIALINPCMQHGLNIETTEDCGYA